MNLILFTSTYPSQTSVEQPFLDRELLYLSLPFDKIIIVPKTFSGKEKPLSKKIKLEEGFSDFYKKQGLLGIVFSAVLSPLFYQELLIHPFLLLFHPLAVLRLLKFIGDAELVKRWTKNWIINEKVDVENTLFYSFWFTQVAMGLGLLKDVFPNVKIIARGHGYDIYEERYQPPYIPCRQKTLKSIDKLFLASADARRYMQKNYPDFSEKYHVAHLGVEAAGVVSKPSTDGVFRIVSCSSMIPLKRVELLAKSIELASQKRPQQKILWVHFGDGPKRKSVQEIINVFPPSAVGKVEGYVPNKEIIEYYQNTPIDIFFNLSTTEGGAPVSIQEAISCGIPVIATNVGGNPEIVSDQNGILLEADPTPEDVVCALFTLLDNPSLSLEKRKGSLQIWQKQYNAQKNFETFADQISSMIKE